MPYTRYLYNEKKEHNREEYVPIVRSMIDQVYNGDAVSVTKLNDGEEIVSYVSVNYKQENYPRPLLEADSVIDEITKYTCRFGFKDNHPCMFITFTNIEPELADGHILCLELENRVKKRFGKCQCINVFEKQNPVATLNMENYGITWLWMSDIEIGTEYCIYIVAAEYAWRNGVNRLKKTQFLEGDSRRYKLPNFPYDWEVNVRIRPTIRKSDGKQYCYFQRSLKEFTWVKYPLSTEYGR